MTIFPIVTFFLVAVFLIVSPFHDSHGIDTKNRKDFANEIIQRVNFLENDNVRIKTKLGNIEQETEVHSDEIQKLSNALEEIQDQGNILVFNTYLFSLILIKNFSLGLFT